MSKRPTRSGFTLVELLVVVAIILILVAIALPHFKSAIVRSQVARSAGEIRGIVFALEIYIADWNVYPIDHHSDYPYTAPTDYGLTMLTTPFRYLTEWSYDPFGTRESTDPNLQNISSSYTGGSGSDNPDCGGRLHYGDRSAIKHEKGCSHAYSVIGIGPDRAQSIRGWREFPSGVPTYNYPTSLQSYSPTNGSLSSGDIFQLTGNWSLESVLIDGVRQ
jgi:prepilin-type N-terminal cleavage/methylation domain-containing protein